MATKAIHLEVVSNLTTDAFIAALDRFTSRRGLCEEICSDNGTNFKGANNQLSELYEFLKSPENKSELRRKLAERKISWNFNPPSAPHFGGIFEAGIKSVKYHLRRAIGDQSLTFEEMSTLLYKIEAILNSRPLCSLSSDVEDIEVITPAHFLVGGPLLSLPEYDWSREPRNHLSRWQLLQAMSQDYWAKWSLEYLHELQLRQKWQQGTNPIAENDVVLLKENNTLPLHWPLARVTKVHPGTDQITRVVTVQRADGHTFQRPVVKVCRLPLDQSASN
nr:PREDICTED: uncharacterized protein LOC109040947 [Bemisia tabaci]